MSAEPTPEVVEAAVQLATVPAEPIVFGAPLIGDEEIAAVVETLRSGWLGTGPRTERFERDIARYLNVEHAVATNSCTAALHLALLGAGVGPGDEVVTTPLTFVATANVIEHCGATPIFADVRADDGNIDPDRVRDAISPRTKALLPVHYAGAVSDVPTLRRRHAGLPIIVDAAHAVESTYPDGSSSAAGSTCAAYSFYVTKNLTTGEGGMLVTDGEDLALESRVRSLHGLDNDAWKRYTTGYNRSYELVRPGFKYNMTDLQAALGIHQLERLERSHARRTEIWERYNEAFGNLDGVRIPPISLTGDARGRHARHLYTLWFDWERLGLRREEAITKFAQQGVGVGWHFRALHLQRYYRERYGYEPGSFPIAEKIAHRTISIPMSPALNDAQVEQVIHAVRTVTHDL
ncbi:MAG TPA: DegT/DnrJ/EryC1/StrS aminotransferase family protein [Gaiellaceae bacterium]